MSAPKMVTERDAVLRERAAYGAGLLRGNHQSFSRPNDLEAQAARIFPLPKIVRPRVISEESGLSCVDWRYVDEQLWWRHHANTRQTWNSLSSATGAGMFITAERAVLLADLIANPTEEVEDDGTDSGSRVSEAGR